MITIEKNSESKLLEIAEGIRHNGDSVCAAHFFFSKLGPEYKNRKQVGIAINLVKDVFGNEEGCIFLCSDLDVFLIFHISSKELFDKVVYQLRYLFIEDPLIREQCGLAFFSFYDLGLQLEKFFILCKQKAQDTANFGLRSCNQGLMLLHECLVQIDVASIVDLQTVCALPIGRDGHAIFDSIVVNKKKLCDAVGLQLTDTLLIQHCINSIDKLVLNFVLNKPPRHFKRPISVTLSAQTIISDVFTDFHKKMSESGRSVVIEMDAVEIVKDLGNFIAAKGIVCQLKQTLCINNLNYIAFKQFDRLNLNVDLVKLVWDKRFSVISFADELRTVISESGANRVILTGCDTENSMKTAQFLGIHLFQGQYINSCLQSVRSD